MNMHRKLLKYARKQLKEKNAYVCVLINDATDEYVEKSTLKHEQACEAANDLTQWIEILLDGCFALDGWLQIAHNADPLDYSHTDYKEQMRITRLAWVKWMLTVWKD